MSFLSLLIEADELTKKAYRCILIDFYVSCASAFEKWHYDEQAKPDPLVVLLTTFRSYVLPRSRMLYLVERDRTVLHRLIELYKRMPLIHPRKAYHQ